MDLKNIKCTISRYFYYSFKIYFYVYMHVPALVYGHHFYAGTHGGQKMLDPPELEVEALWAALLVLGPVPWSSVRTVNALNCWVLSLAPFTLTLDVHIGPDLTSGNQAVYPSRAHD